MEAIIRPARLDDAEALHRTCYPEHQLENVHDYLVWCLRQTEKGWILRVVAEVNGRAMGNAQLTVRGQEGEIGSLVVAAEVRRRGVATQLLTHLIAEARQRGLVALEIGVDEAQPALLPFYERLGFCPIEREPDPGGRAACGEHAVQLRMLLPGTER